jgi:CsoR family transcriptional regulator, copper-sensing transcriptional repressor
MQNIKNSMASKDDILKRLNRIEGQVKGIQRMIEEEKTCVDILTQVAAIRAAINKVGGLILEKHSKECMRNSLNSENKEQVLDELIDTIQKFLKFVD